MGKILLHKESYQRLLTTLFLLFSVMLFAQQVEITGRVLDDAGIPLPGASVLIKNTTNGTVTDFNGDFVLSVEDPQNAVLVFSFISYRSQEVTVNNQKFIEVVLQTDVAALDEVVVIGYGNQKRATLTGSISEVDGGELAKSPQPNISSSFSGRMSGVIANNRSGEPGADGSSISIRGMATTGNNDVLVVVDGVPGQVGGLSRLAADDIESITVLKDASAAIYGSRAANGVILVTTKRGRQGMAPTVSYKFDVGLSSPTRLADMADAATYGTIRNEIAYYNSPDGGMNQIYSPEELEFYRNGSDPLNYPNTDWAEIALKDVSIQTQHNLNVRGGGEHVNYYFSLGTFSQEGIYKDGVTQYDQYNGRSKFDVQLSERFQIGVSLMPRKEDREFATQSAGSIFRSTSRAEPTIS